MAEWEEFIPATGSEVLRPHIGVDHEHLLGSAGRQYSKPQTRWEHRVSKKFLSPRTSSSRSHFLQSRDMQQILETTRAPLATHSDSSLPAVPRFAPLYRPRFLLVPQHTRRFPRISGRE